MQLTDNVYGYSWRGEGNNCNTYALQYFVDSVARYALIDPGLRVVPVPMSNGRSFTGLRQEPALDMLLSSLKADGIDPAAVQMIINTHAHGDHCESSLWWKENQGALVALHEADSDHFAKAMRSNQKQPSRVPNGTQPDLLLGEGELRLGNPDPHVLQVFHTPGHSPGSISLYWPERKVLIVGDLIFYRSVGRTDFPGGSITKMADNIRRLSELEVEHLLTGHAYGHPGIISGEQEVENNFRYIISYILP